MYLFLLNIGMLRCPLPRLSISLSVVIPVESRFGCPIPDKSCVRQVGLLLQACEVRGGNLVSVVRRATAA